MTTRIAVVGGTGNLGYGLALRWARAGQTVTIGSRDAMRAKEVAAEISVRAACTVKGGANVDVAQAADLIVLAVPFAAQAATLVEIRDAVRGKIVVDTTVPLNPPKVMRVQLPEQGSAAACAREILGDGVRLVSAFQNVAAAHLRDLDHALDGDVLVTGDDKAARAEVIGLAEAIGLTAWHAGPLDNAVVAEGLTSILIFLNKNYQFDGAGIRICGSRAEPDSPQ